MRYVMLPLLFCVFSLARVHAEESAQQIVLDPDRIVNAHMSDGGRIEFIVPAHFASVELVGVEKYCHANIRIRREGGNGVVVRAKCDGLFAWSGVLEVDGSLEVSAPKVAVSGTLSAMHIELSTSGLLHVENGAKIIARDGGNLAIRCEVLVSGGNLSADGPRGGRITINSRNFQNHGSVHADGTVDDGGEVEIRFSDQFIQPSIGQVSVNGQLNAGRIEISGGETGSLFNSGAFLATGNFGGIICVQGQNLKLYGARIDASGQSGGGKVTLGGEPRSIVSSNGGLAARHVELNGFTSISANAIDRGNGGQIVLWSELNTQCSAHLSVRGGQHNGGGGFIEVSGKEGLSFSGIADASAPHGKAGQLLLDPKNIVISNAGLPAQPELLDPTQASGDQFGGYLLSLPSGNVVVSDSQDDFTALNAGAVHLFNGTTGALISSIRGSSLNDSVGSVVQRLANGSYVISSAAWDNGAAVDAGAVTVGNGSAGVSGVVSSSNSLVGGSSNNFVGSSVLVLTNGHFAVFSPDWDNGATADVGAVTWCNGNGTTVGPVSTANSVIGSTPLDRVGFSGGALTNGHFVARSPLWDNGAVTNAGAVTWMSGLGPTGGVVSVSNSLVGSSVSDNVGDILPLTNGNYVVRSSAWNNGAIADAGAVTWCNGTGGTVGPISASNSIVGGTANDAVGGLIVALVNGNYVVRSSLWDNGAAVDAGAVTWGNGSGGTAGLVSTSNSLVGSTTNDNIGAAGGDIEALSNGNFVVRSPQWDNGATANVGAITWCSGTGGTVGAISTGNSLVGAANGDALGQNGSVTQLTSGNYVVSFPGFDNGVVSNVGAVRRCAGTFATSGAFAIGNSMLGTSTGDQIGGGGVVALSNGNYVFSSPFWDNGAQSQAGAVTWGNGNGGTVGTVSASNSLVGPTANCQVGSSGVTALTNGNYVVNSPLWDNGALANVGAATWASGNGGTVGAVSTANSLVGGSAGDMVGGVSGTFPGTVALKNGHYAVRSVFWKNGAASNAGSVTRGDGSSGTTGTVTSANSVVGSTANDQVGLNVLALSNGNYLVLSPDWDNGVLTDAGAATLCDGLTGQSRSGYGAVSSANSLVGMVTGAGLSSSVEESSDESFFVRFQTEFNGKVRYEFSPLNPFTYSKAQTESVIISPAFLKRSLDAGTDVILQANNDITINDPILVNNPGGNGGMLRLQAGRGIAINANIFTDNGPLELIANDLLSSGVVDAQRDAGPATISMAPGASLDAGTAALIVDLRSGAGKVNLASGNVSLQTLTGTVQISHSGTTPGSKIALDGMSVNGSLDLSGSNVLSGGTLACTGAVTISSGALTGTGTVSATTCQIASGAVIAPGPSSAALNIQANFVLSAGAAYSAEVNGSTSDVLNIAGTVVLSGTLNTAFLASPSQGISLTLISNDASDAVSGTFAGLPQGAGFSVNGVPLRIQYDKGTGNDVTLFAARPPTDIQLSPATIAENSPNGTVVGTLLTVDDPDGGDVFTFEVTDDAGGRFTVDNNQITVADSTQLDFESGSSYSMSVTVKDADGFSLKKELFISISDANEAPTDLGLNNSSVAEEQPAGDTVGSLFGVDPDSGSVFSYALVSGAGGADNALFAVVGASLVTAQKLDFETKPFCSVRIRCTDAGSLFFEKSLSIAVLNVKELASISLSGLDAVYDGLPKIVTASPQPAGLAVTITYDGNITAPVNAGSYAVSAVINDSNFSGSASGLLTIAKALPSIIWNFPSDILAGTPLGGAQLNASATIPGTFSYEPSAGTVLPVGAGQTLKATFTPSDSANYSPSVATVTINVVPLSGGGGGAPSNLDSDGDGVSDALEEAAGTDPLNPSSSPAAGPSQPLTAEKLTIRLNFSKPASDFIQFSGLLPVPAGLAVAGQKVGVSVGGVARFFTLNAKGNATPRTNDSICLKVKAKKGVVAAQQGKFTLKFKKGTFADPLTSSGLENASIKDKAVSVRIEVLFNGVLYEKVQPLLYSAAAAKSGMTKPPK